MQKRAPSISQIGVMGVFALAHYEMQLTGHHTLGSVAASQNTTVDTLLRLNPGIDPQSLHVGQRIRVG